jgi:hypothetical protein
MSFSGTVLSSIYRSVVPAGTMGLLPSVLITVDAVGDGEVDGTRQSGVVDLAVKRDEEWYRGEVAASLMFLHSHGPTLALGIIVDDDVVLVTIPGPIFFTFSREHTLSLQRDCDVYGVWCPSGWRGDACRIQGRPFALRKRSPA